MIYVKTNKMYDPYWFIIEEKKFNTILFFSKYPSDKEIKKEIECMKDVVEEWDYEEDIGLI